LIRVHRGRPEEVETLRRDTLRGAMAAVSTAAGTPTTLTAPTDVLRDPKTWIKHTADSTEHAESEAAATKAAERARAFLDGENTLFDVFKLGLRTLPPELGLCAGNLTDLSCWRNNLTSLPPALGLCTRLTNLDCRHNKLVSLPVELGSCASLAKLDCRFNKLTSIPPELSQCASMTELDFEDNRLTSLPAELGHSTSLMILDCSKNELTFLPPELGQCSSLRKLTCGYNQLTSLPGELAHCVSLSELDCRHNQLRSLPPAVGQCASLAKLNCSANQLTSIAPELGQCGNLTELDCHHNKLTSLPAKLGQCASLTELDCQHNELTSLPLELRQCARLTTLVCSSNKLTSLPPELGQCASLQLLHCYHNKLVSLPPELGQCASLTTLGCGDNQLNTLPPELGRCESLTTLDCYQNKITSLPAELGRCKMLTMLRCRNNELTCLPPELGQCTKLAELNCRSNRLALLPEALVLCSELVRLDCSDNQIEALPECFRRLTKLTHYVGLGTTSFLGNPLVVPPLSLAQRAYDERDPQIVIGFLDDLHNFQAAHLSLPRVMLVGHGGVGKTTTAKSLHRLPGSACDDLLGTLGQEYSSTRGVSMLTWSLPSETSDTDSPALTARLWDFAGQLEYYATHSLLLGGTAVVYVVVVSLAERIRPDGGVNAAAPSPMSVRDQLLFWLKFLRSLTGSQYSGFHRRAMCVIVGTHIDQLDDDIALVALEDMKRVVRSLPDGFLDRLLIDCGVEAKSGSEDLRLLDLRPGPVPVSRVDGLRSRVANLVRRSNAMGDAVPGSYVKLFHLCTDIRGSFLDTKNEEAPQSASESPVSLSIRRWVSSFSSADSSRKDLSEERSTISYRVTPVIEQDHLLKRASAIFSDDTEHFSRALRYLEVMGVVLVVRGGNIHGADGTANTLVVLDLQWCSAVCSAFLAPPDHRLFGKEEPNNARLTRAQVEQRIRRVSAVADVGVVVSAMIRLDLCCEIPLPGVQRSMGEVPGFLFPALLEWPSSATGDGAAPSTRYLPPSHGSSHPEDAGGYSIARMFEFGEAVSMVPPGLFSSWQARLLRRAGALLANDATVHAGLACVVVDEFDTTVCLFAHRGVNRVAAVVHGPTWEHVVRELSQTIDDLLHLLTTFAGSHVHELAACASCVCMDWEFESGHWDLATDSRRLNFAAECCGLYVGGASQGAENNPWGAVFQDGPVRKVRCCAESNGDGCPRLLDLCTILMGKPLPTDRGELEATCAVLQDVFPASRKHLPDDFGRGANLEQQPAWDSRNARERVLEVARGEASEGDSFWRYDVFLNHAGSSKIDMFKLTIALKVLGFKVFFDQNDAGVGQVSMFSDIDDALARSRCLLTWITDDFWDLKRSHWPCTELFSYAVARGSLTRVCAFLVGMRVDDCVNCGPVVNGSLIGCDEHAIRLGEALKTVKLQQIPDLSRRGGSDFDQTLLFQVAGLLREKLGADSPQPELLLTPELAKQVAAAAYTETQNQLRSHAGQIQHVVSHTIDDIVRQVTLTIFPGDITIESPPLARLGDSLLSNDRPLGAPGTDSEAVEASCVPWTEFGADRVRRGEPLGVGSFGAVYKCRIDEIHGTFAMKLIREHDGDLAAELEIMKTIPRHRSIVALVGASTIGGKCAVIMELLDQSLDGLMKKQRDDVGAGIEEWFERPVLFRVLEHILLGVRHLHRHRVVHRDIKPQNILLEMTGGVPVRACLADFGTSKARSGTMISTETGTVAYMAPEIGRGSYDGWAADVFSTGLVLFEWLSGKSIHATERDASRDTEMPKFPEESLSTLLSPDGREDPHFLHVVSVLVEGDDSCLIAQCARLNAALRPSIETVCAEALGADANENEESS
jgi:Leucine-rich repeat (LRR) protein